VPAIWSPAAKQIMREAAEKVKSISVINVTCEAELALAIVHTKLISRLVLSSTISNRFFY